MLHLNSNKNNVSIELSNSVYSMLNEIKGQQNDIKDLWWNTIINQSGLSIIFAIIILMITVTIGYMNTSKSESIFKEKIHELEKIKLNMIQIARDISVIMVSHDVDIYSQLALYDDLVIYELKRRFKSFNELKILTYNDFIKYYEQDTKEMAHRISSKICSAMPVIEIQNILNEISNTHYPKILEKLIADFLERISRPDIQNEQRTQYKQRYDEIIRFLSR